MILVVIESFVLSFALLLLCVLNIRNTPVGGVHFYEKEIQERAIELGLITRGKIRKNMILASIVLLIVLMIVAPAMFFFVNGAEGFLDGFLQLLAALMSWIMSVTL